MTTALDPRQRRLLIYKVVYGNHMSDLAPYLAAVLYDRVLAEIKDEVDHLSEQLQKS
jgi:hypothetical protein